MAGPLFFSFVGSLVICMALIPVLMASAGRLHVLDLPGTRKLHEAPIARVGGIAFALGSIAAILIWAPKDEIVISTLLGGLIILAFGVWDDRVGLGFKAKFFGQFVGAVIAVWFGGIRLNAVPFFPDEALPLWLAVPVTLTVLVGVTNAINLADGLDGLAGGLSLLSFGGMAYLAFLSGDVTVMLIVIAVLGGLLGFLRFNTFPARIFMGDGGSQFLGFLLGVSAVVLTDPTRGPYVPPLALLILGIPVLDTLGVMVQRVMEGRSPFLADQNHLHHKLLAAGFVHYEAVILIYALQAAFVSLAYLLRWQKDGVALAVYLSLAVPILALFFLAGRGRLRWNRPEGAPSIGAAFAWIRPLKAGRWMNDMPLRLLGAGVPMFLAISVFLPPRVPVDFGWLSVVLFGVLLVGLAVFPKATPSLVRCGLYVGTAFVMYLSDLAPGHSSWPIHIPVTVFFSVTAVLVVLTIRFNGQDRFQTNPMDYLMVFLALVIPSLPEVRVGELDLGVLTAKLIVLFFSYELILNLLSEKMIQLGVISLWVLLGLGVRAWW